MGIFPRIGGMGVWVGVYRLVCLCHAFLLKFELSLRVVLGTDFLLYFYK